MPLLTGGGTVCLLITMKNRNWIWSPSLTPTDTLLLPATCCYMTTYMYLSFTYSHTATQAKKMCKWVNAFYEDTGFDTASVTEMVIL